MKLTITHKSKVWSGRQYANVTKISVESVIVQVLSSVESSHNVLSSNTLDILFMNFMHETLYLT